MGLVVLQVLEVVLRVLEAVLEVLEVLLEGALRVCSEVCSSLWELRATRVVLTGSALVVLGSPKLQTARVCSPDFRLRRQKILRMSHTFL